MDKFYDIKNKDLTNYKSIPFWSWNDKLDKDELISQIEFMNNIGIGGFFMHARSGLKTPYLSEEWFDCIKICIEKAKDLDMNAWIYDENGWPSGFAGGELLLVKQNLVHYLEFNELDYFDENALCVFIKSNEKFVHIRSALPAVTVYYTIYDRQNESYVDILNPSIVEKFIALTHEKYYERFNEYFGNTLKGFFTDEPQYFRWGTPWTPILITEFNNKYGYDILDNLIYLFNECEEAYKFRYDFWLILNELYINNFQKTIYDWCQKNNCMITGHTIDENTLYGQILCSGGVMPFYEYEHIPGIDWLTRNVLDELPPKQCVSVACQLGKKQVLTETFGASGWDTTPRELKRIAEFQYVHGVNLMCQHLFPYSIEGTRKHDYPLFFSNHNPWIKESKDFNDYFTHLGYIISNSAECVDTIIIHPLRSAYLFFDRKGNATLDELHNSLLCITEDFARAQIPHHFGDETIIEKYGKVKNEKFIIGQCSYKTVVLPNLYSLSSATVKLLKLFSDNGGKILIYDKKPSYLDGKKYDYSWLNGNIRFDDLLKQREFVINESQDSFRSATRIYEGSKLIYIVNTFSQQSVDTTLTIKNCNSIKKLNLLTLKYEGVEMREDKVFLHFDYGDSVLLVLNEGNEQNKIYKEQLLPLDNLWQINEDLNNYLTLDYASYSFDNNHYSEKQSISQISYELLSYRKNQNVFIKYNFNIDNVLKNIYLVTENIQSLCILLNNNIVKKSNKNFIDKHFSAYELSHFIENGSNELILNFEYVQDEFIYHALLDEGVTESIKNTVTLKTEVDNCYLAGNFMVKTQDKFTLYDKIRSKTYSKDFTLCSLPSIINADDFVKNGLPFFAGELVLRKEVELSKGKYLLKVNGFYSVAKIFLNNNYVNNLIFNNVCDISHYIVEGKNEIKVVLYNSNRNLLGPHHDCDVEPYIVCPVNFGDECWKNGTNERWVNSYSFVNFGLKCEIIRLLEEV